MDAPQSSAQAPFADALAMGIGHAYQQRTTFHLDVPAMALGT